MNRDTGNFDFKKEWNVLIAVSLFIFSIGATFLVSPPLLHVQDESHSSWLIKFLIAAFLSLSIIPLRRRSSPANTRLWYIVSIIAVTAFLVSYIIYSNATESWTVKYYNQQRLVVGRDMNSNAIEARKKVAQLLNRETISDEVFVKSRLGETQSIWPDYQLTSRYQTLNVLYTSTFILLTFFMVSIVQAIYCNKKIKDS